MATGPALGFEAGQPDLALDTAEDARGFAARRLAAVLLGLSVAPILASNGGFYATSWGWAGMGLAWLAVIVATIGDVARPSRLELVFLGGLTTFLGWLVIANLWSADVTQSALEIERMLVYVAGALAVLTLLERRHVGVFLGAACVGMTAIAAYALATRLFPHGTSVIAALGGYRLARPIGYWNGLGLLAVMATLLALAIAAKAADRRAQFAAGAAVPVLLATQYFTYSRGAWLSLFAGGVVLLATDTRRVHLVATVLPTAIVSALVIWHASTIDALTRTTATVHTASVQGHKFAVEIVVAAVVAGLLTMWIRSRGAEGAWIDSQGARRLAVAAAVVLVVAGAGVAVAKYGSPVHMAKRGYDSFVGSPVGGTNLNARLFSLSSNGRVALWHVAWRAFAHHPLAGIGPGGYTEYWNQHRTVFLTVRNAHSLYLETLAETGIIGLVLLLAGLLAPLAAFARARLREPFAAGALAAFVAYLLHTGVDWDWQLTGVTLAGLFCGGALLVAARDEETEVAARWRVTPIAFGATVAIAALIGLAGNLMLSASSKAATTGDWSRAASDARDATFWAPWSSEPYRRLGIAQLGLKQRTEAAQSFRTATLKSPRNFELWLYVARATDDPEQTRALLHALYLNPLDPVIQQTSIALHQKGTT